MAEAGGASTNAGIYFQNSTAALYMGRMLDTRSRPIGDRVISVRVEAPEHVDDIVVHYADGAKRYIQAKLSLRKGDLAWNRLWRTLSQQLATISEVDRFGIMVGEASLIAVTLRECARRTDSATAAEWRNRVSEEQGAAINAIKALLSCDDDHALRLFKRIDVEIIPEATLDRDYPPLWMPDVADPMALHGHLRDLASGGARTRSVFDAASVRAQLLERHGIEITNPASWGSQRYRAAISDTLRISVPGTSIVRAIEDGFIWPTATIPAVDKTPDFDDEWGRWHVGVEPDCIDLSTYPSPELDKVVVVAGPGFGKSTLLLALTARVVSLGLLPVLITAPDLSTSDLEIAEHIQTKINASFGVSIDWRQAADAGLVVLFLDGLDEVGAARRSVILDRLRRYSAVHSAVNWVLTVRDAAALSAPTEAKLVELSPLADNGVRQFIDAYCPGDDDIHRRLHALFESQPEMRRLSRIPLFLTMLLATAGRSGDLPRNRNDVIENYLSLLWDPAGIKPSDEITTDPRIMRDVAQRAAFDALERDEIGLSQRLLERTLPASHGSRTLIDDLLKCGVLRRPEPSRYEFPFPIVQEYLAACHLVEERVDDIPRRLSSLAKRPWAQAIQFALEQHPAPATIVDDLLAQPDDAFDTQVRLLGRCVANGMKVTEAQRQTIASRLVGLWDHNSFWKSRAVGNLIADGFTEPIAPELRERLFDRNLLYSGSGRILCEIADDALSLEVLHGFVSEDISSLLNLMEFQPEVDRIGRTAFPLYIRAAHAWSDEEAAISGLAALIGHLSDANVDQADVRAAIDDESLPVMIRAAALALFDMNQTIGTAETIILRALASPAWISAGIAAQAALRIRLPASTIVHMAHEFETRSGPEFVGQIISKCDADRRPTLIPEILADDRLAGAVRNHALLFATSFGSEEAFGELLGEFGSQSHEVVSATCALLGHFPTPSFAETTRAALEARRWDATERRSISSSLCTGLSGRLEMHSLSSGSIKATEIHPGMRVLIPLLAEWTGYDDYESCDALRMTLDLVRLGQNDALAEVRPRLRAALAAPMTGPRDLHFQDHVIGNAIEILQDRRDPLSLTELEDIARNRTHNARSSALRAIARQGTSEACDSLMGLYAQLNDTSSRDTLLNALQTLASQLGLRATVEGGELIMSAI